MHGARRRLRTYITHARRRSGHVAGNVAAQAIHKMRRDVRTLAVVGVGSVVAVATYLLWRRRVAARVVRSWPHGVEVRRAIDLRRTFNKIDTGGVGSVTRSQFKAFVSGEGVQFSTQELEGLVNQIDTAASGRVTYSEFADFIDSLTGHISKSSDSSITM